MPRRKHLRRDFRHSRLALEPLEDRRLLAVDFGDAPDPYPTTLADDGARHEAIGPMLGALRDEEANGQPTSGADGDGADEDGVTFGSIRVGQLDASVTVDVRNAPAGAKLDAWIDFNGDGSWGGPGEQIFDHSIVNDGDNALLFDVPSWAIDGNTYARFRLSSEGDLGVGGPAADGEVEDYHVTINLPAPEIAAVSPSSGLTGTVVSISGFALANVSEVVFTSATGGARQPADFVVVSDSELHTTVPSEIPGVMLVQVRSGDGLSLTFPANPTVITNTQSVGGSTQVVVESGGNLTGAGGSVNVFVESGGFVNLGGGGGSQTFYVKSGGTLETVATGGGNVVFYEPGSTINAPGMQLIEVPNLHLVLGATFQVVENSSPIATDDSYHAAQDSPLIVDAAAGVLVNDDDADGGSQILTATIQAAPANGSVQLNTDGSFTYTPNANFFGEDTFTYTNNDGRDDSNIATVTIEVVALDAPPVADDDSYMVAKDTTLIVDAASGVLEGDTGPVGAALTAVLVGDVSNGTLALESDGSFDYTPNAGFFGDDTFTYRAVDGSATSNLATVTIHVVETLNAAPVITDFSPMTGAVGTILTVTGSGFVGTTNVYMSRSVRAARFDAGFTVISDNELQVVVTDVGFFGNGKSVISIVDPDGLAFTVSPDYIEGDGEIGVQFDFFVVRSGAHLTLNGRFSTVLVESGGEVTVGDNDGNQFYVLSGGTINGASNGTDNRLDLETGVLNETNLAAGYHPKINPFFADALFRFVRNTPPVAEDDAYELDENTTLVVDVVGGVLANDADVDFQVLTTQLLANVTHGNLALDPDGGFTYTPNPGYFGDDTFSYAAHDGTTEGNSATVTITVRDTAPEPVAVDDQYDALAGGLLTVAIDEGVLTNDHDIQGDPLTVELLDDVDHGALDLNADGSFTYLPNSDFEGVDTFTYRASDGQFDSNIATVSIDVILPVGIRGRKWHDLDGDGVFEPADGELALADWTIYLDENANGYLDDGEPQTLTDSDGRYEFDQLDAGTYHVAEVMQDGWEQTYPELHGVGDVVHRLSDPSFTTKDSFNGEVAAVGRYVAVGNTYSVGEILLFASETGDLVRTLPNPTSQTDEYFGQALAAQGDYLIAGNAYNDTGDVNSGIAFIIDVESGDVVHTILNPSPADSGLFGFSVAVVGSQIVIGAPQNTVGDAHNSGVVYIFDGVTAELVRTIENPTPQEGEKFGLSVVAFGDNILIGAPDDVSGGPRAGAVYLFDLATGNLLQTFANPTNKSADSFGESMAVVAGDVLIGAYREDTSGFDTGAAYLFDGESAELRHTFYDLNPKTGGHFGRSVASVSGLALIGAANTGVAALYDPITGELVAELTPPTEFVNGRYGWDVASFGDRMLVSRPDEQGGEAGHNAVYLLEGPGPRDHVVTVVPGEIVVDVDFGNRTIFLPIAVDDEYRVDDNQTLVVEAADGVLRNDSDANGDVLTAILATEPQHGTLSLDPDGAFSYTPDTDFFGTDGFTYTPNDGRHDGDPATVTIVVGRSVVDVALVALAEPSSESTLGGLPSSLSQIAAGTNYFVEVWVQDIEAPGVGVSGGTLDLSYTTAPADVTSLSHDGPFGLLSSGQVDDAAGLVDDFGGVSFSADIGVAPQWARLGVVEVLATGAGEAMFSLDRGALEFSRFGQGFVEWKRVDLSDTITVQHVGSALRLEAAVVRSPSETDAGGEIAGVPTSVGFLHEWEAFWVEVWGSTPAGSDAGIAGATFDLVYNTLVATAARIEYGPAFGAGQSGMIDDAAGIVSDVGASATRGDVGDDRPVLLARVLFEPTAGDQAEVDAAGHRVGPYDLGIALTNVRTAATTTEIGPAPQTELWAVIYDVDDSDAVNFGDFSFFAAAFELSVGEAEPPLVWWADFDKSGLVDFGDFSFFTANLLADKNSGAVTFPDNYPEAWRPGAPAPGRAPEAAAAAGGGLEVQLVARLSLGADDTLAALPDSLGAVNDAQTYFVEVWIRDDAPDAPGITGGRVDLQYTTGAANVLSATSSDQYNVFVSSSLDEPAGLVRGLGGGTFDAGVASGDHWARLGYVQLTATGDGPIRFTLSPGDLQLSRFGEGNIVWDEVSLGTLSLNSTPADLTGNGFVDFQDLTILLANWNQNVSAAEGNLIDAASTPVNFQDLTVLLAAWTGPGPAASPQAAAAEAIVQRDTATSESRVVSDVHFERLGRRDQASYRRDTRSGGLPSHDSPLRRLQAAAVDRAIGEEFAPERDMISARRIRRRG